MEYEEGYKLKFLVTSALPYAYAPRHFGHLAGAYLPADIFVRSRRLMGNDVLYVCGTDENAASIILEALREGITPREVCDKNYPMQRDTFARLGVKFDIFSRTSYDVHYETVSEFYRVLWDKGYIEERQIKQLYCPNCEKILPDRFVKGICPVCGTPDQYGESCEKCATWYEAYELVDPRCTICGTKPEVVESTHYFLKLSKLTDSVLGYIRPKRFWRKATYNKTVSQLENEGLRDKDITRDYDWGPPAPFPNAKSQVIYNWAENLLGYVSATKDWARKQGRPETWKDYWLNRDCRLCCFIGKDNLFFHTILFPAVLIAHGDFVLPYNVVVNEFVNLEGQKLSTSRGWVVWLHDMLERFSPDMIRYYAAIIAPEVKDTDFKWKDFQTKINDELIATLGNYVNRVLLFAYNQFNGTIPEPGELAADDKEVLGYIQEAAKEERDHLEKTEFQAGLRAAFRLAQRGNQYLNSKQPWNNKQEAPRTIYISTQILYGLSVLLQPYLPFTAAKIREYLDVDRPETEIRWTDLEREIGAGSKIRKPQPLFKKISDEEIEAEMARLNEALVGKS